MSARYAARMTCVKKSALLNDAIHDLIIARTKVVERVREEKQGQKIKIRPARECSIILAV